MATASISYDSVSDSNALTVTIASLATSASSLAGRESTVVDNTSIKYLGTRVFGQITTGTTPTVNKTISIYIYTPIKFASSTFAYPVATATALTGSDAAATFEADQRNCLKLAAAMNVNATSDRPYSFDFNVEAYFGGIMPPKWGIWITHDTGVNLNSTAGNHWVHWTGTKVDIA